MESTEASHNLTSEEQAGRNSFWAVYDKYYDEIQESVTRVAVRNPEFAKLLESIAPQELAVVRRQSRELLQGAMLNNAWEPYLAFIRATGQQYALLGVSLHSWFDLIIEQRKIVAPYLLDAYGKTPKELVQAWLAYGELSARAGAALTQAYVEERERIIARQQETIRALSTPILQIQDGMLILPIIGLLDDSRARQMTDQLLCEVRKCRARFVIIDLTGVPTVDATMAKYLTTASGAARFLGASVIFCGLGAEVSQTMVESGVRFNSVAMTTDLQEAVQEASTALRSATKLGNLEMQPSHTR